MSIWEREIELREKELKLREWEVRQREIREEKYRAEELARADKYRSEELDIRRRELQRQENADKFKAAEDKSLLTRTKKFAEALKNVFPNMPRESAELPTFFDTVENLFKVYDVPNDL